MDPSHRIPSSPPGTSISRSISSHHNHHHNTAAPLSSSTSDLLDGHFRRSQPCSSRKRTLLSWDLRSGSTAAPSASLPTTTVASDKNSNANMTFASTMTSKSNGNDWDGGNGCGGDTFFDDNGIDWGAAIHELDAMEQQQQPLHNQQRRYTREIATNPPLGIHSSGNANRSEDLQSSQPRKPNVLAPNPYLSSSMSKDSVQMHNTMIQSPPPPPPPKRLQLRQAAMTMKSDGDQHSRSDCVAAVAKGENMMISIANPIQNRQPPPSSVAGVVVPAKQPAQSKIATVASLRPERWKLGTIDGNDGSTSVAVAKSIVGSKPSPASSNGAAVPFDDPRQISLPRSLQFDPKLMEPAQDAYRATLVQHANVSAPLLNGWTLYSHQKKAILRGLLQRRMILALDMGLGKTLIGCVWARAFVRTFGYSRHNNNGRSSSCYESDTNHQPVKVLVICPVSLRHEWQRTARDATGLTVDGYDNNTKNTKSYSFDGFNDDHDMYIASWAKIPTARQVSSSSTSTSTSSSSRSRYNYVVVADEAHSMQNMQSARTQETLQLCLSTQCVGVLLLTGTPMKNGRPSNLFPLLRAVRHPLGQNQRAYETHFCNGQSISYGGRGGTSSTVVWNASGCSNLAQLHQLTQSHLLHLTKAECLHDLPPQTRVFHRVPVSSRCQIKHQKALQDVVAKLHTPSSHHGNSSNNHDAILGAIQRVRMIASESKIDATVELAKQVLQNEPAVVIFTSFVEVARTVQQQLALAGWQGAVLLTGETPPGKRQGMVDQFQSGLTPIFVATFGAGGVGLTLTAACTVILLDRPWTPGDAHQAEDRVRRIGQTRPVTSIWMTAFDLDEHIDAMLERKQATASTVLANNHRGDEDSSNDGDANTESKKLSLFQLLKEILPPAPSSSLSSRNNNNIKKKWDGFQQMSILSYSQSMTEHMDVLQYDSSI